MIHIDNGIDFPESYEFRDSLAEKWGMELIVSKSEIKAEMSGFACCGSNKTDALKRTMKEYGFDALIVSIRRDEHGIRAKERTFSPRDKNFKWDYKNQPEELWNNYSAKEKGTDHVRVHPLLDFNEVDVWNFIKTNKIPEPTLLREGGLQVQEPWLHALHRAAEVERRHPRQDNGRAQRHKG